MLHKMQPKWGGDTVAVSVDVGHSELDLDDNAERLEVMK